MTNPLINRTVSLSDLVWEDGDPFNPTSTDMTSLYAANQDVFAVPIYRTASVMNVYMNQYSYKEQKFACEIDCNNLGRLFCL